MIDHTILAPEHNERRPKVGDDVVQAITKLPNVLEVKRIELT